MSSRYNCSFQTLLKNTAFSMARGEVGHRMQSPAGGNDGEEEDDRNPQREETQ